MKHAMEHPKVIIASPMSETAEFPLPYDATKEEREAAKRELGKHTRIVSETDQAIILEGEKIGQTGPVWPSFSPTNVMALSSSDTTSVCFPISRFAVSRSSLDASKGRGNSAVSLIGESDDSLGFIHRVRWEGPTRWPM